MASPDGAEKKFVPAFIDFIGVGIFGVAIHQFTHEEYASGMCLSLISVPMFIIGFYWNRLAARFPSKVSETAISTALDFRWWVTIVILLSAYFAAFPFFRPQHIVLPPNILTSDEGSFDGSPLGMMWKSAHFQGSTPQQNSPPRVTSFSVTGKNLGGQEISLKHAYIISGISGEMLPLEIGTPPSPPIPINEAAPVPADAWIEFTASFGTGLSEKECLNKWQRFAMVVKYDESTVRHEFARDAVMQFLSGLYPQSTPHVSKRQP